MSLKKDFVRSVQIEGEMGMVGKSLRGGQWSPTGHSILIHVKRAPQMTLTYTAPTHKFPCLHCYLSSSRFQPPLSCLYLSLPLCILNYLLLCFLRQETLPPSLCLSQLLMGIFSLITGRPGPSGFGSASTAEQVTEGVDASNLTAIVTGGASGIGFETARVLALRKAHVVIAARNLEAASEAKQLILKDNEAARVDVLKLDLCSMKSIREFVENFNALNLPLNLLINNAGIMFCPFHLSQDGIESQFATNHIGHFLLTNLLLDKMKNTARTTGIEGRIVNLSSIAHIHTYENGIKFDGINDEKSYSDKKAYGQSKLANILHAKELSQRLQEEGANITVNAVHPGLIMTNLFKHSAILMKILQLFTYILWKNVPQGAATTCYVALHPSMKGVSGKYYLDCNEMAPSAYARDETLAEKLWDFSNKLVNSPPTTSN